MKIGYSLLAAGLLAVALATQPAQSASLLGGLINTGADSGNGSGVVSNNDNGSIGIGGSNGASVNLGGALGGGDGGGLGGLLGGGGGGGGLGGVLGGGGNTGVPGVAEVSNGNGGTNASLLGGGGSNINVPLGNLLGGGGNGLNVELPNLGLNGLLGGPGNNGNPGAPGGGGTNGLNGFGGSNGFNGFNGGNGSAGVSLPSNISSRLRSILQVLAARDWIALANGRAICLSNFGKAEVSNILPQSDWSGLNQALPSYAQDISTLRQLLANCRSSSQRQALDVRDLNRVIGIDIKRNGQPVLYML